MSKTIEERVRAYQQALENPKPRTSPTQKLERLQERLQGAEASLLTQDKRRMSLLARQASYAVQAGDHRLVFAAAAELAHMARLQLVGLTEAYEALPGQSSPPPALTLPAFTQ